MENIVVIDISPWTNPDNFSNKHRQNVSRQWADAFQEVGFAIIVGHGITEEILQAVSSEARSLFSHDSEFKMQFNKGPYGNPEGGYTPPDSESVALSIADQTSFQNTLPDPVESFVMLPHSCCDEFKRHLPTCWAYTASMESLLNTLHEITTSSLGLPERDYFRKYYDTKDSQALGSEPPSFSLRLAYYPSQQERPASQSERPRFR